MDRMGGLKELELYGWEEVTIRIPRPLWVFVKRLGEFLGFAPERIVEFEAWDNLAALCNEYGSRAYGSMLQEAIPDLDKVVKLINNVDLKEV